MKKEKPKVVVKEEKRVEAEYKLEPNFSDSTTTGWGEKLAELA